MATSNGPKRFRTRSRVRTARWSSAPSGPGHGRGASGRLPRCISRGVGHIVYTSVVNPVPDNPFPPAATHLRSEADLVSTGVAWTILRNALYADLRVQIAASYSRAGRWTTNIGAGAHAFVARADCAAAAAAALTTPGHEGRRYTVEGPTTARTCRGGLRVGWSRKAVGTQVQHAGIPSGAGHGVPERGDRQLGIVAAGAVERGVGRGEFVVAVPAVCGLVAAGVAGGREDPYPVASSG
jgi:uncharacterized protein YbjT (DUF2867 family)